MRHVIGLRPTAAPAAAQAATAPPPPSSEAGMERIKVFFEDGCQMENIRAFMLISQLKDLCERMDSIPPHPENDASCCSEIIKNGLILDLKPVDSLDDVIHAIENAVNIKTYEVMDTAAPAAAEAAPAPAKESAPAQKAPAPAAAAPAGGEKVCAPMPGTILDVKVANGAAVKKGDILFILEAMKMENEIMAPCNGTVASLSASKGAAVESGALLCVIA